MLTQYFTQAVVRFNPASRGAKLARVFLASLPPSSRGSVQLSQKLLTNESNDQSVISVTFKDGHVITVDPLTVKSTVDMTNQFDQYSRKLKIKDDISDS